MDEQQLEFERLQSKLRDFWPSLTLRSIGDIERTAVVVHSISFEVPDHLIPTFPAYEERFLCLLITLLRGPRSRVIYVTSQPILPRIIDYFFRLVPELDTPESRSRFHVVSLVDGTNRPLSAKLLERPGALERIRRLIADPEIAFLLPFSTSPLEVELAVRLGIPLYGADPSLEHLGTKRGGRRVFTDEDVPLPLGFDVDGGDDVVAAIEEIRARRPEVSDVVVKLNRGVSGLGNALVHVAGADGARSLGERVAALELEDEQLSAEEYLAALDRLGGIVEERILGDDFRSPSVQLRISPAGQVDVLSTHDQVLGGPHGQTYFGCHFPADEEYAPQLALEGLKVGKRLAREGVIGRCAVDFVCVRSAEAWKPYALEINLRCGGTTHPFFTLQALTDGLYDPLAGEYRSHDGALKHYAATDHLDDPAYASLTPDDLLDVVSARGIGWDPERETGVALHMVSALAVAGRIGLTAIGDTLEEARMLYYDVKRTLDQAVADLRPAERHDRGSEQ
jgi:hypothetical protein